ncbi:uncharacterized protein LOC133173987 [Saccostrea echinata]|uniref:uncharacterized protein LOC133173987 n=1 Tax=Saccostrea echinata TaxID=191078 RepID=UPI002A8373C4|nr:uncharacterized protein LOC133173987 [Saccostrea echinata]
MDHLFTVDGKLCQCSIERSTSNHRFCCLKVSLYGFCQNRKRFMKCQDLSIDIKQDIVKIVDIKVKLDILTGFNVILLYTVTKSSTGLVFQLERKFRSCRVIAKFDTLSTSRQNSVYFIDGPGILRDSYENIIFHRGFNNQKESVFLKNASMKSVLWSGYCEDLSSVVIISYISRNDQTELSTVFLDSFSEEWETVDSSLLIPEEFKNLVTANVLKLSRVTDHERTAYFSDIITLTTDGFFIYLQHGRILWALPTSISDTESTVLFSWSAYSLNTQFAVIHNDNVITFINTKEGKIIETVTDVIEVYQDDFVDCGQTQVLCRFSGFSLTENSGWLLTDKGAWLFDQRTVEKEVDLDESHRPAVLALQKRLQNELIAFHNKSHAVNKERSKFITDNWRLLLHLNQCSQAKGAIQSNNILQISSEKVWQVANDSKWLVGLNLVNSYDSPLCDLSLSLLPIHQDGCQSGKVLHTRSEWLVAEYPENRSSKVTRKNMSKVTRSMPLPSELQPLERGVVVCETDLPSFVSHSQFSCEVILTLTCGSGIEGHSSDLRPLYIVQHSCGVIAIEAYRLIKEEYSLEMVSEKDCKNSDNWLERTVSLLTHIECHLELRTVWSNASRLADWMEKICQFHFNAHQNCYKSTLNAFSGMKLIIHPPLTHDNAHVTVYSKSEKQVLLLVRHLYDCLADDVVIFSHLREEDDEGLQKAIGAIRKEMELMKSPQEALKKGSKVFNTELPETDDGGAILVNNVRENFRKRKEATKCAKDEDRKTVQEDDLYQAQQHTDGAISKLFN